MMQQTETYQLNLIETSDTFSPAPLNENAQKLEAALTAARTEAAAGIAAGDAAEAQARVNADAAEAQARVNADAAEAQTRASADAAEAQTRAAADAALGQRVTALELHKFAAGTYVGNGQKNGDAQFISLGFTPAVVITDNMSSYHPRTCLCTPDLSSSVMEIVTGGFMAKCKGPEMSDDSLNTAGKRYRYAAIC